MLKPLHQNMLLAKGLKLTHLRMLAAFAETAQIGVAAELMGITQPAASRLLAEVERICGQKVHLRAGRGVELTEVGQALALRAQRVLMEMRDAAREIEDFAAGSSGRVSIGAVTAPALGLILPTVREARLSFPNIQIEVTVTTSDILFDQLIAGTLDFAIARVPAGGDANLVDLLEIAPEPVDLIVRKDHPLTKLAQITLEDLLSFDWVLPNSSIPLAATVLNHVAALGYPPPRQRMTTGSFLLTLALLQQSNAIAPLASAVADQFASGPDTAFARLQTPLNMAVSPYSLMTRKDARLPRAAQSVMGVFLQILSRESGSKSAE
jgi:DNA-binding transcriptional LysR family regulator